MKILFDLFPVVLFFVSFKLYGIYAATGAAIAATFVQIGWMYFRRRKVETMLWVSLGIIVVFGGATLLLRDETFIKWKPTVLYWLFAIVLTVSDRLLKKNVIAAMLQDQISLPPRVWQGLTLGWTVFFALLGAANLYVAFNFATSTWVNFKLFGTFGLMLVFILAQALVLSRYAEQKETGA